MVAHLGERPDWDIGNPVAETADDAVCCEPFSASDSLIQQGKIQGIYSILAFRGLIGC
jgi:hypothetical protein